MVFSIRTAPHLATNMPFGAVIVSVWDHRNSGSADRSAVFINADVIMDCFGMSAFAVEVNSDIFAGIYDSAIREADGKISVYNQWKD